MVWAVKSLRVGTCGLLVVVDVNGYVGRTSRLVAFVPGTLGAAPHTDELEQPLPHGERLGVEDAAARAGVRRSAAVGDLPAVPHVCAGVDEHHRDRGDLLAVEADHLGAVPGSVEC